MPTFISRRAFGRGARRFLTAALLLVLAGCGGGRGLPGLGSPTAPVPDLRGARVMLFPVQSMQGVEAGADAELAYALSQRGGGVDWVLPDEMAAALRSSPGMDTRLEGLPVGMFLRSEVQRVGDPLYGYLRRVGTITNSDVALIPVVARHRPATETKGAAVEIAAAILSVRSGDVLWFGFVEGSGAADDPRALASAADALSRRLLPFGNRTGRAAPVGSASYTRDSKNERAGNALDENKTAILPAGFGARHPRM